MKFQIDASRPHLGGNVIGGDPWTFYPELWKWLIEEYEISTVLDIGCGTGQSMEFFKKQDCIVFGVDGLEENIKEVVKKGLSGMVHDYTTGPATIAGRYDLCWCCEFVEHVGEECSDNFLKNFQSCSIIAMTHAVPGQGGHHHVNCKDDDYWIDRLHDYGFKLNQHNSLASRKLAGHYWTASGLIFTR